MGKISDLFNILFSSRLNFVAMSSLAAALITMIYYLQMYQFELKFHAQVSEMDSQMNSQMPAFAAHIQLPPPIDFIGMFGRPIFFCIANYGMLIALIAWLMQPQNRKAAKPDLSLCR
jgi:hypothetical protein